MQDVETPDRVREVWGDGGIRAFVSHVATYKEEAAKLKESLEERGIAAFVAHEQIDVSQEWQGEIDFALRTMHLLIAVCTPGFNESAWANQEIGFAIGSQRLPIAIRKGVDPIGLQGKYQAMSGYDKTWDEIADEILGVLSARDDFQELKVDALIRAIRVSGSFNRSRTLLQSFQTAQGLTPRQEQNLVVAINQNVQINSSYVLEQSPKQLFLEKLRTLTTNQYEFVENHPARWDAQLLRPL